MLALVVCQISGQDQFYGRNENTCLQKGGMCILGTECEKFVEGQNLCPEQKSQGFECCQGLPKSEHRCRKLGGECFKTNYCSQKLTAPKATDCKAEEECCILV
ncbi:uncharacterized protein CBL_03598 [Carabus blaptoides fortunei]